MPTVTVQNVTDVHLTPSEGRGMTLVYTAPVPPPPGLRICRLGDSITSGEGTVPGAYGPRLAALIAATGVAAVYVGTQSHGPSTPLGTADEGYSGYTIAQVKSVVDAQIVSDNPNVVILHVGINDIAGFGVSGADAATAAVALIADIVSKVPGAAVFVCGIIPYAGNAGINTQVQIYNAAVRDAIADEAGVYFVDLYPLLAADVADYYPSGVGAHPNATGYALMGDGIFGGLRVAGTVPANPPSPPPPPPPGGVPSFRRFDFGTSGSPIAADPPGGVTRPVLISDVIGNGADDHAWVTNTVSALDTGLIPAKTPDLLRDFHWGDPTLSRFQFTADQARTYSVRLYLGDVRSLAHFGIAGGVIGALGFAGFTADTPAGGLNGSVVERTLTGITPDTNGLLTLEIQGGPGGYWTLCGMDVWDNTVTAPVSALA